MEKNLRIIENCDLCLFCRHDINRKGNTILYCRRNSPSSNENVEVCDVYWCGEFVHDNTTQCETCKFGQDGGCSFYPKEITEEMCNSEKHQEHFRMYEQDKIEWARRHICNRFVKHVEESNKE